MSDLIERLEAATEGSADLDFAIAELVGTLDMPVPEVRGAPHYTTSIDAALTLVPEGWGWSVGDIKAHGEIYDKGGQPWAEIWIRGAKPTPFLDGMWRTSGGRCGINTATPAIALCIAALRARQSETPQGSE